MFEQFAAATTDASRAAEACACLPWLITARRDQGAAQNAFATLMSRAGDGPLPGPHSLAASLLFVHAALTYGSTFNDSYYADNLLPFCKRIIQQIIAAQAPGARMDDGGLLWQTPLTPGPNPAPPVAQPSTRLNALWHSVLETTATQLTAHGDKTGDHFERLAGRFTRSFTKTFWCETHKCICPPDRRTVDSHGIAFPDREGLLFISLPSAPTPKTKQRLVVAAHRAAGVTPLGLQNTADDPAVYPLLLVNLAEAYLNCVETPTVAAEARAMVDELARYLAAHPAGLPKTFVNNQPTTDPDLVTTCEAHRLLARL